MKISKVKEMLLSGESFNVEIMRNPTELSEWIIWIRDTAGKSYMLCTDDELLITSTDTNQYFVLLQSIGLKQATVIF